MTRRSSRARGEMDVVIRDVTCCGRVEEEEKSEETIANTRREVRIDRGVRV